MPPTSGVVILSGRCNSVTVISVICCIKKLRRRLSQEAVVRRETPGARCARDTGQWHGACA